MKKISAIFVALMLVALTAVTAFAAGINSSEQAVLDALNQTITLKGGSTTLPTEYVNQAENYLNTVDLTAEESEAIVSEINAAKAFVEAAGVSDIAELTYEQKTELLSYGQAAASVVGLTLSYDKTTKTVSVLSADGEVVFSAVPSLKVAGGSSTGTNGGASTSGSTSNTGVIKTTGSSADFFGFIAVGAVAVVLVAGSAVFFVKTKRERV